MKVGEIHRWDFQADIFGGQYEVMEHLGGRKWLVKRLPADAHTEGLILDFWADEEARGAQTCPIWDKTWAECDEAKGERPSVIGHLTYEQELERELARIAEWAGTTMVLEVVSRREYDRHF